MIDDDKTIEEAFARYFRKAYEGSQEDLDCRADFLRITYSRISWAQVHGDFKDIAKRALFKPYEHWPELHECCGIAVRAAIDLHKTQTYSGPDCARIMGAAMAILKKKYGQNVPRWWLPLMRQVGRA